MSFIQKILRFILPSKVFAAIEAGTRQWLAECPCGHKRDYFEAGGIRYKACGNPRVLLECPNCRKATMHLVQKKTEEEKLTL
jgi:hypothetical protein